MMSQRAMLAPLYGRGHIHDHIPKGQPWAFTDSRFLYLPPHHCFSVPVLKQVQSLSIALGSGLGRTQSLESQYRIWRSL
jgi:hypothetical protein